jgi:AIG2-like family
MVLNRTEPLTKIADGLGAIKSSCESRGLLHLFDNNKVAQYFFCRLLNAAYDLELVELDNLEENYPAIDLGDTKKRIAYQVTTTKTSDKVIKTLETYCRHGLDKQFDRVVVLVIGDRQKTYDAVVVPAGIKFSIADDIIDIGCLVRHIGTLDTPRLQDIQRILDEEVTSPLRLSPAAKGLDGLSIDIGVLRDPPAHTDPGDTFPDDRVLRYALTKEKGAEEVIVISPQMGYLSRIGSAPLEAISFFHNPFKCDYPTLDVTFVNNTGVTLAVTEAVFEVAESVPDPTPVIVLKDNNAQMRLSIQNEGWGKVCNPIIHCNILPTGETELRPDPPIGHIPVGGPYAHEFPLPDFEDFTLLELDETFAELGVDLGTIRSVRYVGQTPMVMHAMQNGLDKALWQHYGRFPDLETNEAWAPFPDGYAVLAGALDYADEASKSYSVPFRVRVFLFQMKRDIPMPPSYTYNVMLEPQGKNYEVACQAVHSLRDGEPDRIQIRLGCTRSSTHAFRIRWRLNGGRELVSGPIRVRHFIPSRRTYQRKSRAEVGQVEEVQSPPAGEQVGCVEASIRYALAMSARRAAQQTVGYFAYGSNMHPLRLQKRAKSARPVIAIVVRGYVMRFNKRDADGSAKCNIVRTGRDEDTVGGVVFAVSAEDMADLDAAEQGYERLGIQVSIQGQPTTLLTYGASDGYTAEGLQPFTWYKNYVLEGATAAGLPPEYIETFIRSVESREGPEPADSE